MPQALEGTEALAGFETTAGASALWLPADPVAFPEPPQHPMTPRSVARSTAAKLRPASMPGVPAPTGISGNAIDYSQIQADLMLIYGSDGTAPARAAEAETPEQHWFPEDPVPRAVGVRFSLPSEEVLPEGPQRALAVALHSLHARAGWPGVFSVSYMIRQLKRRFVASDTAIEDLFRGEADLRRSPTMLAVIEVLASMTNPPSSLEFELRVFERLWDSPGDRAGRRARTASHAAPS